MSDIIVVGASGFIGSAVSSAIQAAEQWRPIPLRAPRIRADRRETLELVRQYDARGPKAALQYAEDLGWWVPPALGEAQAIVNAAGIARPTADEAQADELRGANAIVPFLLRCQQQVEAVPRLLHISSAAVLGRAPLSASTALSPLTPYARSKAAGEALLLRTLGRGPGELHVYRPTSVQASDAATAILRVIKRIPVLPIAFPVGPSPVISPEDVGDAIVKILASWPAADISIHPPRMNAAEYLRALNPRVRLIRYPRGLGDRTFRAISRAGRRRPRLVAAARRVEVVVQGQPFTSVTPRIAHDLDAFL